MRNTSVQDVVLEELRSLRKEYTNQNTLLTEVATTLKSVEAQTIKTNGRVSTLEKVQNQQKGSIRIIAWVVGVVLTIIPSVIALHKLFLNKN